MGATPSYENVASGAGWALGWFSGGSRISLETPLQTHVHGDLNTPEVGQTGTKVGTTVSSCARVLWAADRTSSITDVRRSTWPSSGSDVLMLRKLWRRVRPPDSPSCARPARESIARPPDSCLMGRFDARLFTNPGFAAATLVYTTNVANSVSPIQLTPTATQSGRNKWNSGRLATKP